MIADWDRRDTRAVLAIAAAAFSLRLLLAAITEVVSTDAAAFLIFAREMGDGLWTPSLERGIHPAYPVAIALAGALTGDLERAAYFVSVLFSSLALVPFYALVRDLAGRRAAILSGMIAACFTFFIVEQADILSDGMFHFFFVTSVALAWFAATRRSFALYVLTALAGALAYYTRPEGVYVPVALVGLSLLAVAAAKLRKQPPRWEILGFALIAVALFLALAFPLLLQFRKITGEWKITWRGSVEAAMYPFRSEPPRLQPMPERARQPGGVVHALGRMASQFFQLKIWFWGPLFVVGLVWLRGRMRPLAVIYLACLIVGYLIAPLLAASYGYALSRRYALLPILFMLPLAAMGCLAIVDQLARRWDGRRVRLAASVVLGLALLAMSIQPMHPRRTEEIPVKQAALWVKGQVPGAVYCNVTKAACYLGRRTLEMPVTLEELGRLELRTGEYALVVERKYHEVVPGGLEQMEARFRRVARFPEKEERKTERVSIFSRP